MNAANGPEERLFESALELPAGPERQAFLNQACGDDKALRQRLETLLQAHDNPATSLEPENAKPSAATIRLEFAAEEGPGTRIGRYKLLQKIGEGGMGIVYMAEQEEPVRRRVALKIIKLGMDTRQVVARFEAERQALALMDHPNIAKVLDGGATETGRPYFVMELVQGVPITEYCDKAKLPAKARVKLFIQVCQAIQSAHQKGIIHRDIKPSNVLVTLHDGVPVPKVIDFGIAKATNQKLTEKTLFTNFATMIGTPAYMSPEQAEMSGLDVDTRTDIYALGVLLYALLTGTTPFPEKRLRSLGYGEMQRVILEEEPERPSTRLSTMANEQKTIVARNCGEELASLSHLLKGDLDWIVMKCLEKDRQRRYETANGLAADLRRHLENEPVVARPQSAAYRLQKMVRRNKGAALATAGMGFTIILALVVSTAAFLSERKARLEALAAKRAAESESIRADSVTRFMKGFFDDTIPQLLAMGNREPVRRLLGASELLTLELTNAPIAEAQLHFDIGTVYADIMWDYKPSIPHFRATEQIASKIGEAGKALGHAAYLHRLGTEMWMNIDTNAAAELIEYGNSALKESPPDSAAAVWAFVAASEFKMQYGTVEEAERLVRRALKIPTAPAPNPGFKSDPARDLGLLIQLTSARGAIPEAESTAESLLALLRPERPPTKSPADAHNARVFATLLQYGWDELPETSLRKALAESAGDDEYTRSILQRLLGVSVARSGNREDGLKLMQSAGNMTKGAFPLWSAEIQLAALIGPTNLQHSLAVTGLAQFANDADPVLAQGLASSLLMIPTDPAVLSVVSNLVSKAIEGGPDISAGAKMTLALLRYRAGDANQASQALEEFLAEGPSLVGHYYFDTVKPTVWFLRSAIEMKLGNLVGAQEAYRQGFRLESPALRTHNVPYSGPGWQNACAAEILRREAASLLGSAVPATMQ